MSKRPFFNHIPVRSPGRSLLLWLLIALLALSACQQTPEAEPTPTPEADSEAAATAVPPAREGVTILADGVIVAPRPTLELGFNATGRVAALHVAPGDVVTAGQLIATLDDQALQDGVASASAALAIAEAQLAEAQAPASAVDIANAENAVVQAEIALEKAQADRGTLFVVNDQAAIIEAEATVAQRTIEWDQARRAHEQLITNEILGAAEEQARLAADNARIQLEAAEARLNQLRNQGPSGAQLQSADAVIAQAEANLANVQQQLELLQLGPAAERLATLEAQKAQAELSLAQAEQALADAQLLAPWSGTVLEVRVAEGGLVGSGTAVVALLDTSQLEFHTNNLSERDLAQIGSGRSVAITLKTYPDTPLSGSVARIAPQTGTPVGDAATFPVIIQLEESELDILPGMTGRAEIQPEEE